MLAVTVINYISLLCRCWSGDMNKRPDFAELRKVRSISIRITSLS